MSTLDRARKPFMRPVATGAMLFVAAVSLTGCKANKAGTTETKVAYWVKQNVTVGGKHDKNPNKATAESVANGKQVFTSYCMVCHGLDGQNTGVPFAKLLSPAVPNLASTEVQGYTDGQLKWIIQNGLYPSGMPPATSDFAQEDMWDMVNYIRHLPPAGSLGEPSVYSGK